MKKKIKDYIKQNERLYFFLLSARRFMHLPIKLTLIPQFIRDYKSFGEKQKHARVQFKLSASYPCLLDKNQAAGSTGSYLKQDLWAAQKIDINLEANEKHYDIGSRLDGFITNLLSSHKSVVLIDIRPLPFYVDELLEFVQADATNLQNIDDESIGSLSALCSLEHFGMGRYGDPIDPDACFKSFDAIQRVLKKGGHAYISVPVGIEKIEFNAHRIFNPNTIINAFSKMKLLEFSVTSTLSSEAIVKNADPEKISRLNNFGGGVFGLFEFEKI